MKNKIKNFKIKKIYFKTGYDYDIEQFYLYVELENNYTEEIAFQQSGSGPSPYIVYREPQYDLEGKSFNYTNKHITRLLKRIQKYGRLDKIYNIFLRRKKEEELSNLIKYFSRINPNWRQKIESIMDGIIIEDVLS